MSEVRLLFQTALEQSERSGLPKILEKLAEMAGACGCILWQVATEAGGAQGKLFVLADWFPDERRYLRLHDIPLRDDSAIGRAILSRSVITASDQQDRNPYGGPNVFLIEPSINSVCAVPIAFHDGAVGAVSLYRASERPFSEDEVAWVEELARMVPGLYQAHRDRVSLNLLAKVNEILHKAEVAADGSVVPKESVCADVRQICKHVGDSFNCVETSIFLEDSIDNPGLYELSATTHPGAFDRLAYGRDSSGLTGWVLRHAKPVKIFDLASFEREREDIQRLYPEMEWNYLEHTVALACETFNFGSVRELPPLGFIAAPIMMGGKVHGVIRCSIARRGPYYFAERELSLLKIVAAQLGRYWSNWLGRRVEASNYQKIQSQTFQDLSHQLISPIMQAHRRAQSLIETQACSEQLLPQVYAIRGLCAKTGSVVRNTRIFADLASGRPVRADISRVLAGDLVKMLAEAAQDNNIMVDPSRGLKFDIACESFGALPRALYLDLDLITQAVNNLLDNASKYSFANSTISISGGAVHDRFYISVANKGIRLRLDEVRRVVERGWRGQDAQEVTGEGSGIGLWVVENVMRAHGGELHITPTTRDHVTRFRLIFPTVDGR
ncbi:MAG: GAF domain-containing protein [Pyrinomonadaceae bacterium]